MTTIAETLPDAWESLCDAGRHYAEDMDAGRWKLGDLALKVEKQYGQDSLGEFAREVNVRAGRIREYRRVCDFYENVARAAFLETHPVLSYSHLRAAMRLGDADTAYAYLVTASENRLSVEATEAAIRDIVGGDPPPARITFEARLVGAGLNPNRIVLEGTPEDVKRVKAMYDGGRVQVKVAFALPGVREDSVFRAGE